jgi:tetratricopeptide (TPR) repeat protein
MRPSFVVCALLFPCCAAGPQRTHNPDQTAAGQKPVVPAREPDPVAFQGVESSLTAGRKDEALEKAKAIVSVYPDSVHANVLAGAVLLQLSRPADAVSYFLKVVASQPDDAHSHSLLLEAYAESGDRPHRDEQRAILRRFHADGKHPAFAQLHGIMIERIPVGNESVAAIEYFAPEGPHHFSYRFDVYDTSDKMIEFIALAAEDSDQPLRSGDARPTRRHALSLYTQDQQTLLGFIDGTPSYDDLRARVVRTLAAELDVNVAPTAPAKP